MFLKPFIQQTWPSKHPTLLKRKRMLEISSRPMSRIPRFSIHSCRRRIGYEITDVISYLSLEQCTNLFYDISFLSISFKQMFLTWLSNMSLVADKKEQRCKTTAKYLDLLRGGLHGGDKLFSLASNTSGTSVSLIDSTVTSCISVSLFPPSSTIASCDSVLFSWTFSKSGDSWIEVSSTACTVAVNFPTDFHATMTRGPKIINQDKTNHRKSPKQFWWTCSSVQYISQCNCELNILVWFPTPSVTLGWILMPSFPLAVFNDPLSLPLFLDIVFFIIITWKAISACLPCASCSSSCLHAHQWCPLSDDQTKAHAKKTT